MKKFLSLSIVAVALVAVAQQEASAWSNIKFGAGVNMSWQTGDNTLLWGLFRNGQIPPPPGFGAPHLPPGMPVPPMGPGGPPHPAEFYGAQQNISAPAQMQQNVRASYQQPVYSMPAPGYQYYSPAYQTPGYAYPQR